MNDIELPRQDAEGNYYISYSQYSTWKELKSFNLGILGKQEYILSYFMGVKWPDQGWAQFGSDVEDYICTKDKAEAFTESEKETLAKIKPIGVFQKEIKLWILPNVYVYGFIDDCNDVMSWLRDYKTASNNSRQRYYKDDYTQLDIYAMFAYQETGKIPEKLEVCIIERKGNCFGMVERRDLLSVGKEIWYHERETSPERLAKIKGNLIAAILEISNAYKLFKKLNK